MKIAAAQISCSLGNPDANLLKVRDFTARAKEAGANLIVFPEMVDIGYSMLVIRTNAASWTDGFVPELQDIAGKLSIAIVSGLSERDGVQNTRGAEFAPSFDTSRIAHVSTRELFRESIATALSSITRVAATPVSLII